MDTSFVVNTVLDLLRETDKHEYIGEPISQLQHGLQCAALAQAATADEEVVLAALLHDIGHICYADAEQMADVGTRDHETLGAEYLFGLGFSKRVADLVAGHVTAKRYLVTMEPGYRSKLSAASMKTLEFQGGLLDASAISEFEADPDFKTMLQLRAWDEAAKLEHASPPGPSSYVAMLESHLQRQMLVPEQLETFHRQGYLQIKNYFSPRQINWLQQQVSKLQELPEVAGKWMKYFEQHEGEKLLCRVENFVPFEEQLAQLIAGPRLCGLVGQLMGQDAVLFKEKINFKLPGGAGFEPHQDAPAFTSFGHQYHITTMLSFDASTIANGCLEMVAGDWGLQTLPMTEKKTIADQVAATLDWQPLETDPGDLVLFGSYIPHRSGANKTLTPRRALYATYNRALEGDVRHAYFEEKRRVFPPEIERVAGRDYSDSGVFNVGNPVST